MHKILHLNAPILPSIHPWLRLCLPYSLSKSVRKVTQFSPSLSSCLCSGHLILLRDEMRLLCLCQGLSVFHTWSTVRNRGAAPLQSSTDQSRSTQPSAHLHQCIFFGSALGKGRDGSVQEEEEATLSGVKLYCKLDFYSKSPNFEFLHFQTSSSCSDE